MLYACWETYPVFRFDSIFCKYFYVEEGMTIMDRFVLKGPVPGRYFTVPFT